GAVRDQRDAKQRTNALVQEYGVEHLRVVHLLEDHGASLFGDPPGDAFAGGDSNSVTDLFLDAFGRRRDELLRIAIKQENGRRVDLEGFAHALQKRGEEVVEVQVSERGVG